MPISIDEDNLKRGLLGLVVALVEIIQETLERHVLRRIDGGRLNDEELTRLNDALADLDEALEDIKRENDIEDATVSIRDGLDQISDEVIDKFVNPRRWAEEVE